LRSGANKSPGRSCRNEGVPDTDDAQAGCNVIWDSPSRDASGSMPLGNGDIAVNAWVEEGGDLLFYVSKTDAWSEHAHLLKLARLRVSFRPRIIVPDGPFHQELRLRQGEIRVQAGRGGRAVTLSLWVDANLPVIRLEAQAAIPLMMRVTLETWRNESRQLHDTEADYVERFSQDQFPTVSPDIPAPAAAGKICWYHRNETSVWRANLQLQGMEGMIATSRDPLLGRTFGGQIAGRGMVRRDERTLESARSSRRQRLTVCVLTAQTKTAGQWLRRLRGLAERVGAVDWRTARRGHQEWWERFWRRGWIRVEGHPQAGSVTRGYALQRYINACAGRGGSPIKFNGTIFTVETRREGLPCDPDFRMWGGPYWFQNTRLIYWSMLSAGDFDLMAPLWEMYRRATPLARHRSRVYYGHQGVFFPETMHFWGTYFNFNYGYQRQGKPAGLTDNTFIRYYWQGGLELVAMMLDRYDITRDRRFLTRTLLPLAVEIVKFFDRHWQRDSAGTMRFEPASSLETWHRAVNPLAEIAGLAWLLPRLLALPSDCTNARWRRAWRKTLRDLPAVPMGREDGKEFLLPAEQYDDLRNVENPELYAVFPYRLFGVGKPRLETALETYARRRNPQGGGWQQNAIQAACLGLGDPAAQYVLDSFSTFDAGSRFPAFWGPNYDWVPDQTHGAVAMIALQRMLCQAEGDRILLFPAWPRKWDVHFKLHVPRRTTVEGVYRAGRLEKLLVSPVHRAKDIINCMETFGRD